MLAKIILSALQLLNSIHAFVTIDINEQMPINMNTRTVQPNSMGDSIQMLRLNHSSRELA
jgi:hypothetical protein